MWVFTISLEVIERYGAQSILHSIVNVYAKFDQLWVNHQVQQMYVFKAIKKQFTIQPEKCPGRQLSWLEMCIMAYRIM